MRKMDIVQRSDLEPNQCRLLRSSGHAMSVCIWGIPLGEVPASRYSSLWAPMAGLCSFPSGMRAHDPASRGHALRRSPKQRPPRVKEKT